MFCRKCGTQIPNDSQFCIKCGAKTVKFNTNIENPHFTEKDNKKTMTKLKSMQVSQKNKEVVKKPVRLIVIIAVSALIVLCGIYTFIKLYKPSGSAVEASLEIAIQSTPGQMQMEEEEWEITYALPPDFQGTWVAEGALEYIGAEPYLAEKEYRYITIDGTTAEWGIYNYESGEFVQSSSNFEHGDSEGPDGYCSLILQRDILLSLNKNGDLVYFKLSENGSEYTEIYLFKRSDENTVLSFIKNIYCMSDANDFYGIWTKIGIKYNIDDEVIQPDNDSFGYLEINDSLAIKKKFYTNLLLYGTGYSGLYKYEDDANEYEFIEFINSPYRFILDENGYLLEIDKYNQDVENYPIYVYERSSQNNVDAFFYSIKDKFVVTEFTYNPMEASSIEYIDIGDWQFVGFAFNPYVNLPYSPKGMLDFVDTPKYEWRSHFNFDNKSDDLINFYSTSTGDITLSFDYEQHDEYETYYFKSIEDYGNGEEKLNFFFGTDNRMYVCFAEGNNEQTCTTHFYVYERTIPNEVLEIADTSAKIEDFAGIWDYDGNKYILSDDISPSYYEYNILNITAQDTIKSFVLYSNTSSESVEQYEYIFNDFYLMVKSKFSDSFYNVYIIDKNGDLIRIDCTIKGIYLSFTLPKYYFFESFNGSVDDCKYAPALDEIEKNFEPDFRDVISWDVTIDDFSKAWKCLYYQTHGYNGDTSDLQENEQHYLGINEDGTYNEIITLDGTVAYEWMVNYDNYDYYLEDTEIPDEEGILEKARYYIGNNGYLYVIVIGFDGYVYQYHVYEECSDNIYEYLKEEGIY